MKRALAVVTAAVLAMLLGFPAAAMAGSAIDEAVTAIQQSRVYVAPGVNASAAAILARLNATDGIAVAMFPADAPLTAEDAASQIDSRLGHHFVVAVAVGDKTTVSTKVVPAADAAKAMSYAASVSTSPAETLTTFADNIHQYQKSHPAAKVTRPVASKSAAGKKDDGDHSGLIMVMLVVAGVFALGMIIVVSVKAKRRDSEEELRLRSPDKVREQLKHILELRPQIRDAQMRADLLQAATDVEALFQRARRSEPKNKLELLEADFQRHLSKIGQVVARYIDIQDNSRYYDNSTQLLRQGAGAIRGFAEFALDSVKRIGKEQVTNYRVDADILDAQRYR